MDTENKMKNALESVKSRLGSIRAGRANPALLNGIMVSYYGTPTPIQSIANIMVPEARQLLIKPFDKSALGAIEKAIIAANLGYNPSNDGETIRIIVPALTEERRKELVKDIKKMAEEAKVAVRAVRRDGIETAKAEQKEGNMTEDELKQAENDIQKLTDTSVEEIDKILANKEKEVMSV